MAPRKKAEGLASIVAKQDPVSIQELTMQDFFAAFALQGICASGAFKEWTNEQLAVESYDIADEMLQRRVV
jgi:hypothetical protein